jgi:hypothetical protein
MPDTERPRSADEVIEAVARAHWRTVQSALARDGFEGQVADTRRAIVIGKEGDGIGDGPGS